MPTQYLFPGTIMKLPWMLHPAFHAVPALLPVKTHQRCFLWQPKFLILLCFPREGPRQKKEHSVWWPKWMNLVLAIAQIREPAKQNVLKIFRFQILQDSTGNTLAPN